ncbi:doublecortin domain-containing protein 2-like [Sphaeramia orbicularis]|uniref:doublecortin domain-containing protein 2-like n=1 Tax=Sphaeramia orbicularis TaxID=375764 RepID=UPI001180B75E|nr:doublecortin domain-containing protein 2 [Sphaeramia orbicularis]
MSSEKPNFLSQPVVKNIFMFRNGDPYYEARRIVINQKRVCNFETLLREVTGGIQPPFGAVRNIYTPRGGHKVDCLDNLQSGEQYVAAGRERFKKLDYLQIGSRKKRLMQTLPMQVKPLPQNRIIVSARFLKPIKEPCPIFVVANGDVLNPAMRLLIHQRMLGQFERILEMITEKMGLRVLGGVRSLFTYEGQHITDGNLLESGQLYVAVGREKFKKLPYSDLLFTKPRGMRRVNGMKAYSLPPIYRLSKQNGNGKSMVQSTDSTDRDSKASPPAHNGNSKEHLSSIVREISQARLISLRKRRSGQSMSLGVNDNDDVDSKTSDGNSEDKNQPAEEKCTADATEAKDEPGEKAEEKEEDTSEKNTEEKASTSNEEKKDDEGTNNETEGAQEQKENEEPSHEKEGELTAQSESVNGGEKEEVKEEVKEESTKEGKSKEQESSSRSADKTQDSNEKEAESAKGEKDDQDKNGDEVEDKDSGKGEKSSPDLANDVDTGEEQKEKENSNDPDKPQSDNDTKDNNDGRSSRSNVNQEGDGTETKEGTAKKSEEKEVNGEVNGEVSGEDDEVKSEAELDRDEKDSSVEKRKKDRDENGENRGKKNPEGKV